MGTGHGCRRNGGTEPRKGAERTLEARRVARHRRRFQIEPDLAVRSDPPTTQPARPGEASEGGSPGLCGKVTVGGAHQQVGDEAFEFDHLEHIEGTGGEDEDGIRGSEHRRIPRRHVDDVEWRWIDPLHQAEPVDGVVEAGVVLRRRRSRPDDLEQSVSGTPAGDDAQSCGHDETEDTAAESENAGAEDEHCDEAHGEPRDECKEHRWGGSDGHARHLGRDIGSHDMATATAPLVWRANQPTTPS